MNGAILQLVTSGVEDDILTKDPEITFFKNNFRRHTVFGSESIPIRLRRTLKFGGKSYCYLDKKGDMLTHLYFVIDLPKITTKYNSLSDNSEIKIINSLIKDKRKMIKMIKTFNSKLDKIKINIHPLEYHKKLLDVYKEKNIISDIYKKVLDLKYKSKNVQVGLKLVRRYKEKVFNFITKNENVKAYHKLKVNKKIDEKSLLDIDKLAKYWFDINDFIDDEQDEMDLMNFVMRNYIDTFKSIYLFLTNKKLNDDNLFEIFVRKNKITFKKDVIKFINTYLGKEYKSLISYIENDNYNILLKHYKTALKEFLIYCSDIEILDVDENKIPDDLINAKRKEIIKYINYKVELVGKDIYDSYFNDYYGVNDLLEYIEIDFKGYNFKGKTYYELVNEISNYIVNDILEDELLNIVNVSYYSNTLTNEMKIEWKNKFNILLNKTNSEKLKLISRLRHLKKKNNKCNFRWERDIGIKIIKMVKISINGKTIDQFDSGLLDIYLRQLKSKTKNLDKMLGNLPEIYQYDSKKGNKRLIIPLPFWINNVNLPLVALKYSTVRFDIELNKIEDISLKDDWVDVNIGSLKSFILADFKYLDHPERNNVCNLVHEQLIVTNRFIKYNYHFKDIRKNKYIEFDWFIHDLAIEFIVKCEIKNKNIITCEQFEFIFNDITIIKQDYEYFHSVLPYKLRGVSFDDNYMMFSFALNPKNVIQPSGTLTCSKQKFRIYLTKEVIRLMDIKKVELSLSIYARCYDVLRIGHGYGGIIFI